MTALAVVCALLAAALFAVAATRQHAKVADLATAGTPGLRTLSRLLRSPGWWAGTALAVGGSLLHVVALSLAPLPVVQPLGVFSLVLTVLFGRRMRDRRVLTAVVLVVAGVGGFVALAASASPAAAIGAGTAETVAVAGFVVAAFAWFARAGCAVLAAAAAVLFGLGSSVVHAAAAQPFGTALLLGAQAMLLLGAGGVLLHRAYAAGPTAVVIGTTTVLDPLTAVAVAALAYGEAPKPVAAIAAVVALAGVRVLAGAVPPARPTIEEKPVPEHPTGLRVLIGADTFPPNINGAAFFAERLARGLAGRGHDVHVVCPSDDGPPRTEPGDGYTIHRVRSRAIPFHGDYRFCTPGGARRAVGAVLDEVRPDVVHVQAHFGVGRALLAAAAERDVPGMATNHFMPDNLLGYTPFPRRVKDTIARWAWKDLVRVYRDARIVTTPTPRAAEVLAGIGLDRPAQVVSCGIDLAHYAAPGVRPAGGPMSILFVGRLDAEKNVDQLLRAVAPLPHVRVDLVGDGTRRHDLEELADELRIGDRVTFHGFVSDAELVRRYAEADVFCMPGTAELQSLATMEAMAAGLPVVAADALALPHLVHHGENGYLFEPGAITTIARWIADLAADPDERARMGEASRAIVARHDIAGALATFEAQYRILAGLPAPSRIGQAA